MFEKYYSEGDSISYLNYMLTYLKIQDWKNSKLCKNGASDVPCI
jgi:hypothetical protein